jgi:hypothetical protein
MHGCMDYGKEIVCLLIKYKRKVGVMHVMAKRQEERRESQCYPFHDP